jgi:hypothetical protein
LQGLPRLERFPLLNTYLLYAYVSTALSTQLPTFRRRFGGISRDGGAVPAVDTPSRRLESRRDTTFHINVLETPGLRGCDLRAAPETMMVVEIPGTVDVEPSAPRKLLGTRGTVGTSENVQKAASPAS